MALQIFFGLNKLNDYVLGNRGRGNNQNDGEKRI